MFKLMGRIQNWVLTIAGVATAGLFGITATDIQGCIQSSKVRKAEVSVEERKHILRHLRIGSLLNNTNVPNDQLESFVQDYANSLRKAEREGVAVSDHELGLYLHRQFEGKQEYKKVVDALGARYGLTVGEIESYFRDNLLLRKLSQMDMLSLYVTRAEIKDEFHRRNDEWVYDRVMADSAAMIPAVEPSEEELKSWFEEHAQEDQFLIPERVVIEYLMVNHAALEIPEADDLELREFYNQHRDKYPSEEYEGEAKPYFEVMETVREDYRTEAQKSLAKRMLDLLDIQLLRQEQPDFEGLLKSELEKNPELSNVTYGRSDPFTREDFRIEPLGYVFNLTQRVFGPNPRNYGGVLEAGNGYYIYRVAKRFEKKMMDFAHARSQVEEAVSLEKKSELALELLQNWEEKIVTSGNWSALDLPPGLNYQRKDVKGVLTEEGRVLSGLKEGEASSIFPLGKDHVLLKVVERVPADEALLEEKKDSLKDAILRKKFQEIRLLGFSGR